MEELINGYRKLRDVCDDVVNTLEEDENAIESAIGSFIFACIPLYELNSK